MAINIADSFNRTTAQPPFAGVVFSDLTERDAYATTLRYEGMECYVVSELLYYSLVGGVANGNWIERAGGSGSGVVAVADLTARNAIPELKRTNGMLVQVVSEDQIYKLIGLPLGATTTDANWDAVITSKAAQVITAKDIDGGTASNTSRITIPKALVFTLQGQTSKQASVKFGTDTKDLLVDDGTILKRLSEVENYKILAQYDCDYYYGINHFSKVSSGVGNVFDIYRATGGNVLRGAYSYHLVSIIGSANRIVFNEIDVPLKSRNTMAQISLYYKTSDNRSGVSIYDVTNSAYLLDCETDSKARFAATGVAQKMYFTFNIPANCEKIKFEIGGWGSGSVPADLFFDEVEISEYQMTIGPVITGWQSYTPTISTASGTLTNYTLSECAWMQDGPNGYYKGRITFTGAVGTWTEPTISLPSGQLSTVGSGLVNGAFTMRDEGTNIYRGQAFHLNTSQIRLVGTSANGGNVGISNTSPFTWVNTDSMYWILGPIPIQGWSSTARFADYTLNQDVSFVGFRAASTAASPTVNVKVDSVKDTVGAWDAVNGEYEVKSAGDMDIEMSVQTSTSGGAFVYKNGTNTGYFIGASWGTNGVISGSVTIPNCVIGDKLSIRLNASFNLTNTYLSFSKRATSQQLFTPIAQRYIVKTYQSGTAWYEVCNDGWVRQGDYINTGADSSRATTLVIPMKDTNYNPRTTIITTSTSSPTWEKVGFSAISSTQVTLWAGSVLTKKWSVEGYGDSAAVKALGANPSY